MDAGADQEPRAAAERTAGARARHGRAAGPAGQPVGAHRHRRADRPVRGAVLLAPAALAAAGHRSAPTATRRDAGHGRGCGCRPDGSARPGGCGRRPGPRPRRSPSTPAAALAEHDGDPRRPRPPYPPASRDPSRRPPRSHPRPAARPRRLRPGTAARTPPRHSSPGLPLAAADATPSAAATPGHDLDGRGRRPARCHVGEHRGSATAAIGAAPAPQAVHATRRPRPSPTAAAPVVVPERRRAARGPPRLAADRSARRPRPDDARRPGVASDRCGSSRTSRRTGCGSSSSAGPTTPARRSGPPCPTCAATSPPPASRPTSTSPTSPARTAGAATGPTTGQRRRSRRASPRRRTARPVDRTRTRRPRPHRRPRPRPLGGSTMTDAIVDGDQHDPGGGHRHAA